MAKRFDIHEWQAKIRLTEQNIDSKNPDRDPWQDLYGKQNPNDPKAIPGKHFSNLESEISKYIGQTFASWMSPSNPPFAQEYAQPQYIDKLVGGIMDIIEIRMMGSVNEKKGVPHYTKDGKEWTGATHKMPNGPLMTQNPHNEDSEELFHKEDLEETSTTGTGTSFNAGSGEGYMTPNAFKKKKK